MSPTRTTVTRVSQPGPCLVCTHPSPRSVSFVTCVSSTKIYVYVRNPLRSHDVSGFLSQFGHSPGSNHDDTTIVVVLAGTVTDMGVLSLVKVYPCRGSGRHFPTERTVEVSERDSIDVFVIERVDSWSYPCRSQIRHSKHHSVMFYSNIRTCKVISYSF